MEISWEKAAKDILKMCGVFISDTHVVYNSGRHGSKYVNKDLLFANPILFAKIVEILSGYFSTLAPDVVVGAAVGGSIVASHVAHVFSERYGRSVPMAFAEADESSDGEKILVFKRGYADFVTGKRVLIVEDVVNEGVTVRRLVVAVKALSGHVVGLGIICNRGGVDFGDLQIGKIRSLVDLTLESYAPEECPLCRAGVPVNTLLGKGREFLEKMKNKS